MPALPPPPARRLTPAEAAAVAKRGRKLMRAGRITHHQLVLLDCLLWSCRNPATGAIVVSYTALERLARMARGTVAGGLRVLERLGVLSRIKGAGCGSHGTRAAFRRGRRSVAAR